MGKPSQPKGRRTSTGSREIEVKVTRDKHGRRQVRDAATGRYAAIKRDARRQADLVDRVDKRLKWGSQTNGWWFIPPQAGGKYNWVRRENHPTVIRGFHYKPNSWGPVTGPQNPGLLDERGRPVAPHGTPMSGVVPMDVRMAAQTFGRSMDPSTRAEKFVSRQRAALDYGGPTGRSKVREVGKKKKAR
jgi:hypothetical protein